MHLLGVATLLIAAKYEEIYPPELRDFLAVSENKFTKKNVLDMEKDILLTLNFRLTAPSSYRFLQRYRRISPAINDDEVFFYAQYLQEISLLDATLLKFKPSQIAAASVILSAKQLKKINCWNNDMVKYTGYKEEDLTETVEEVKCFALEINPKFIQTLRYKFGKNTMSIGWSEATEDKKKTGAGKGTSDIITVGFERNLGKGVTLAASVFNAEDKEPGTKSTGGFGAVGGLKLKF